MDGGKKSFCGGVEERVRGKDNFGQEEMEPSWTALKWAIAFSWVWVLNGNLIYIV